VRELNSVYREIFFNRHENTLMKYPSTFSRKGSGNGRKTK